MDNKLAEIQAIMSDPAFDVLSDEEKQEILSQVAHEKAEERKKLIYGVVGVGLLFFLFK